MTQYIEMPILSTQNYCITVTALKIKKERNLRSCMKDVTKPAGEDYDCGHMRGRCKKGKINQGGIKLI